MPEHPLKDSYLLVDRAERDLQALATKHAEFLNSNPYRITIKANRDAGRNEVVPEFSKYPDPDWQIDFGIIANHLRSALDYIPAYLANPDDPDASSTQFPIFASERDYLRKDKRGRTPRDKMLDGVPGVHKRLFDQAQPYKRREDRQVGPLNALAWATNAHKHRKLHASVIALDHSEFTIIADGEPWVVIAVSGMNLSEDEYLYGFTAPAKESLSINYTIAAHIAFGKRRLTLGHLGASANRVREILKTFETAL